MLKWITLLCCMVSISSATNTGPRYIGCYEKLRHAIQSAGGHMTVDACARKCAHQHVAFAGLKNGNQCWCTNSTVYGIRTCDGCCQKPCEGNSLLKCGGSIAFDIYQAVVDGRYLGCYLDKRNSRLFVKKKYEDNLTAYNCIQYCKEHNYPYSGTQNARECYCGHGSYEKHGECITNSSCTCNARCTGDQTEICGGAFAMSVYSTEYNCHCKDGNSCNIRTGRCPSNECAAGWQGSTCSEECGRGKYGANCRETCDQCSEQACDRFNGHCSISCAAGMKNFPLCDRECDDKKFGMKCAKVCHCQNGEICDKRYGSCPGGVCSPGYDVTLDPSCHKECKTGKFGLKCQYQCRCKNSDGCDKVIGACEDNLCAPGFDGPHDDLPCQRECKTGKFGLNCQYKCRCKNSDGCDKVTGACEDNLCAPGFDGPHDDLPCQTECKNGTFGPNCGKLCNCLDPSPCNKSSGFCPNDLCALGIDNSDKTCQTECQAGTYGFSCAQTCECPNNKDCHKVTGKCEKEITTTAITSISVAAIFCALSILFAGAYLRLKCKMRRLSKSTDRTTKMIPTASSPDPLYCEINDQSRPPLMSVFRSSSTNNVPNISGKNSAIPEYVEVLPALPCHL